MTRVSHAILIRRPLSEVFAYAVDPSNVPRWQPAVVRMRADGPVGLGQRVVQTRRLLGRHVDLVVEVCEFESDSTFGLRIVSGPVSGTLRSTFLAVDDGTRMSLVAEVPGPRLIRAAGRLAAEAAKRELVANCSRLKALLEQEEVVA